MPHPATTEPGPLPFDPLDDDRSADRADHRELRSADELRALLGTPHPIVIDKVRDRLIPEDLELLARSPFCLLSTSDGRGNCDASPRGDVPGFVRALDSRTLVLPDRPGNRRADSFHNILENRHVGLVHLVPGSTEVLRVNGRARILTDAPFFDGMTLKGQRPLLALLVEIDEIFRHCPAALHRSGLWRPETWPQE
ncbi:MSMEG_1061 family FMN-dependent PPOX-type flavoprotein [Streptomyces sp. NPDC101062]|uniref:MSMEG_1061 family FMN-dependent PPOX-type flavoprotein n=1 Tax=unclassified Streptomyces TaxID=2593676 RepID=UPI00381A58F3